jgi:hypothetical protein
MFCFGGSRGREAYELAIVQHQRQLGAVAEKRVRRHFQAFGLRLMKAVAALASWATEPTPAVKTI